MIYRFPSLDSTSTQLARMADEVAHGDIVITFNQTAGRGQRGNSWESEPGKNLTFSMLLRPSHLAATDAWLMSMAVSVGLVRGLAQYVDSPVKLKWPNDVYVGDRKLCGILIENALCGASVSRAIVGIGINVNQTRFVSNASNPVSIKQLTGQDYDLDEVLSAVCSRILESVDALHRPGLKQEYMDLLWRGRGQHSWRDTASGEVFSAEISDILPDGRISLGGRIFWFKEVAAVL